MTMKLDMSKAYDRVQLEFSWAIDGKDGFPWVVDLYD